MIEYVYLYDEDMDGRKLSSPLSQAIRFLRLDRRSPSYADAGYSFYHLVAVIDKTDILHCVKKISGQASRRPRARKILSILGQATVIASEAGLNLDSIVMIVYQGIQDPAKIIAFT